MTGVQTCALPICAKSSVGATEFCIQHGGGRRCHHVGCTKSSQGATEFCIQHGGGRRCQHVGCTKSSVGAKFCVQHGGGRRCIVTSAHVLEAFPPSAGYANGTLSWGCFAALHPERAKSKIRKEHLVLAKLQRRCTKLFEECDRATWDCPVEGGCSLKRPDMALDFGTQVVIIEVDELQHEEASCWDEILA